MEKIISTYLPFLCTHFVVVGTWSVKLQQLLCETLQLTNLTVVLIHFLQSFSQHVLGALHYTKSILSFVKSFCNQWNCDMFSKINEDNPCSKHIPQF